MSEENLNEMELITMSPALKMNGGMSERRKELVREYHGGFESLVDALAERGEDTLEGRIEALVHEIMQEAEHLLGNELVATEDGNLRDATIISTKRADILEKALKAVMAKQVFEREHGVDVESPSMRIVFEFFLHKVRQSFARLGYGDEVVDTFLRTLMASMANWKKELKAELKSITGSED